MKLPEDALEVVAERTEGWPAGIVLSLQALEGAATAEDVARTVTGDLRQIAEYLSEVVLDQATEERRRFLLATSVLSELTPQACDAVLAVTGSAERLAELEASSSFVVALDDHRRSYRYHRLLAELLRAELERSDPRLARECLSRAAVWYEQEAARPGEAFRCARACEDFELAGRSGPRLRRRVRKPRPARDPTALAERLQRRADRVCAFAGARGSLCVHAHG